MTLPFKIRCGSCKVILTIKKESLVGKKIACPKCKAPMVVRPPASKPSAPAKKVRKPASSQSIELEDQNDEFSDDGFANTLESSLSGEHPSRAKASAKKGKVLKRKVAQPVEDDFEDDDDFLDDDDYGDDEFLEDDDDFLSEDEVPVTPKKSKASGKKKSSEKNKFILPGAIVAGVLLIGAVGYAFFSGPSGNTSAPGPQTASNDNAPQDAAEAPVAPTSRQSDDEDSEVESKEVETTETVAETETTKPETKEETTPAIVKKELKKTGTSFVSRSASGAGSEMSLAHLYADTEAVVKIDLKAIMDSSFVKKLMEGAGESGVPGNNQGISEIDNIVVGIKGLSKFAESSKGMIGSPMAFLMPNDKLENLSTITVMRFNTAVDPEEFLMVKNLAQNTPGVFERNVTQEDFEGKTIYVQTVKMPGQDGKQITNVRASCFYDDLTLIMGSTEDVKYALKNPRVNISGSSEFAKSKYDSYQFSAILAPSNPKEFFTKGSENQQEGNSFNPITPEMLEDFEATSLSASFGDSVDLKANLLTNNEETTKLADQLLKSSVQLGLFALNDKMESAPEQFKEIFTFGTEVLNRVQVEPQGNELNISLSFAQSDTETLAKLPGAMMGMMMGMAMQQSGDGSAEVTFTETAVGSPSTVQTANNLKQIGLAFHNYHDVFLGFPASSTDESNEKKGLSWRVSILPFIGYKELFDQFDLTKPWDDPANLKLADQMPDVYKPQTGSLEPNMTRFRVVADKNTAVSPGEKNKLQSFRDGTSNTVLVFEVDDANATLWTKPDPVENSDEVLTAIVENVPILHAVFADGSYKALILFDAKEFRSLLTRNGGEEIPPGVVNGGQPEFQSQPVAKSPVKTPPAKKPAAVKPTAKPTSKVPVTKGGGLRKGFIKKRGDEDGRGIGNGKIKLNTNGTPPQSQKTSVGKKPVAQKSTISNKGNGNSNTNSLKSFITEAEKSKGIGSKPASPASSTLGSGKGITLKRRGFSGGDDNNRKRKSSSSSSTTKKKSTFLSGGGNSGTFDEDDLNEDEQKLVDAGARITRNENEEITRLILKGKEVKDDLVEIIGTIDTLEHLVLSDTGITDEGVSHLTDLSNLKVLILNDTGITDACTDDLISISSLETLSIKKTKITDAGAEKIGGELKESKILH